MARSTYLLVHGAWHGAWCWDRLTPELDARGISWRALDLPSAHDPGDGASTLETDAAAVVATAGNDPVVLVGHSYGGAVIAEAASRVGDLRGLLFLAALVPEVGESSTDALRSVRVHTALDDAMVVEPPFVTLDPATASAALYQDLPVADQRWALGQLRPQTLASFRYRRVRPDTPAPRHYVLCSNDHALDPALQAAMAGRCDTSRSLASGHSPFISHVRDIADVMESWPRET